MYTTVCDFYPGVSCGDPRFTGADGNTFYFHGKKDQNFFIVTDAGLHIDAHFIGNHNRATKRDFTWIQELGIRFAHHSLYVGATRAAATWDAAADHLALAFDEEAVTPPSALGGSRPPRRRCPSPTYRTDYVNRLNVTAKMPVMGGAYTFRSSGLFDADCAVARFGRNTAAASSAAGAGIAMATDAKYL
ncbi:unnamed protein product [Miscanthus lutarioriparius]|uniref:Uncharacterized protein n=1 Tax=Miscanthus lutarioriparius TaxID=422564 RepID=A0A811MUY0_9POAL|nr:unnamed protein product [Miscanthus lutarioriparius]